MNPLPMCGMGVGAPCRPDYFMALFLIGMVAAFSWALRRPRRKP